ncbi:hypothetical protein [Borreliella garinii]|uniref:hypothetical protein n=1 Tax=Borreliella garinii TaxID=29519 RepID=UPI001F355CCA|nr:hypothetical protein [Borreliella garinii]
MKPYGHQKCHIYLCFKQSFFNKNNKNAFKLSKFSSLKITNSWFSKNKGDTLHLVDITSARPSNNISRGNKVEFKNSAFSLLIDDTFLKKILTLPLMTKKSNAKALRLHFGTYTENTKNKEEGT